ncbi:MAG: OFA family MFS transporter [Paludibacter sp.]|nr:OFA family MFS transporter [Paludibacter sp.]
MKKLATVISSFGIMLCLGSVYAWSVFVPELIKNYHFSSTQTQLVFGLLIAVFPTTMIFVGKLEKKWSPRTLAVISALFFSAGYLMSGFSNGNFYFILLGNGFLAGIGTGFGYLASLTTPVKWFPHKKGLITGIAAGGFGLAAFMLSFLTEYLFSLDKNVLTVFIYIGIGYGLVILFLSNFLKAPDTDVIEPKFNLTHFISNPFFYKLVAGIFFGTFSGLLIIGNLMSIGSEYQIDKHSLIIGVSFFALANFSGRLFWGFISDYIGAGLSIFLALTFQAVFIFLIGYLTLSPLIYILLSALIGFGFGGNFVLFAKETSQEFGISNLGIVYPYVFLGYAVAGIFGPLTGGAIYDIFNNYDYAAYIAAIMSLMGAFLFIMKRHKPIKE